MYYKCLALSTYDLNRTTHDGSTLQAGQNMFGRDGQLMKLSYLEELYHYYDAHVRWYLDCIKPQCDLFEKRKCH